MEIEHCLLDWPKAIWFLLLTFCCSVTMETTYDVTQISLLKNDSENSTSLWIVNSTVVSDLNSTLEIGTNNTEDDDCLAMESLSPEELECLLSLPSPPNIEDLPPPPLPPFLKEIELLLHQSNENFDIIIQELESPRNEEQQQEIVPIFEDANCPLCQWSRGNNETLLLFKKDDEGESLEGGSNTVMIWVLLGVAILSATVGAFLTGIFFKCRRRNVISICSKSSPTDNANPQESGSDTNTQLNSKLGILRFSFRKMGICSKKSSLDPYRSESIQNTYSESPYINTDSSSTMYAEISSPLNGICGSSSLNGQPCSSDAYSEVPDPFNKAPNQGIYCNSNYVTSEGSSEQNESSGGSTSTPSSAYYSDVSTSLEVHVNKRKKKKRKFEDKSLRLAPSQRLRKNYLPTSRSQQQHPCSSNERFMQNLRERNQNYYCTGNLIQNLMGKPRNEVSLADLGPSASRDGFVPPSVTTISHPQGCIVKENKGSLVNKVPLCLHFGNVCSEQGHLISDIYTGETQAIENGTQGQCCNKNNPASLSQANDNIYADNMYCLENLCSAHAGCSHTCDSVFPQQSQIADLYQDKPGCYRFTSQNQVPDNGFPHAEVAYFRQSKNKGCRCSVGTSVCCERESIKRKVLFPQQEIISKPDWNPSKENLHTFHKHPSKDCATTCDYNNLLADSQYVYTDGHINNGNIYFIKHNTTDPHHQLEDQTPNIYFGKNGKGENIYFTKANVCTPALPHPQLSTERTHPVQHTQQVANAEKGDSKVVQHSKEMKQSLQNMNDQQNDNFSPTPSEYI